MERGEGIWVHYPDGTLARRVQMEPRERAAMHAGATRLFVIELLFLAAEGGCTHFAATDGSRIGAEASADGRPHAACGVFEGLRGVGSGLWEAAGAYGCAPTDRGRAPDRGRVRGRSLRHKRPRLLAIVRLRGWVRPCVSRPGPGCEGGVASQSFQIWPGPPKPSVMTLQR